MESNKISKTNIPSNHDFFFALETITNIIGIKRQLSKVGRTSDATSDNLGITYV
jgi:hypothetical protein